MGVFDWFSKSNAEIKEEPKKPQERIKSGVFSMDFDAMPSYLMGSYNFGGSGAMSYNTDALLLLMKTVPQLSSIINYTAAKGAEIPVRHVRFQSNGKVKDLGETDAMRLIQSPNRLDNETRFKQDILTNILLFGNNPIIAKRTPGFEYPTQILNEAPNRFWVIPQYSLDMYGMPDPSRNQVDNPVVLYRKQLDNGRLIEHRVEDVIYLRDINPSKIGRDYYYGMSRVYAATRTIGVLGNIYDTINTILANKGPLGFVKRNSRQGEQDPMAFSDLVDEFETKYHERYGIKADRRAIMATMADLSFEKTSLPISEFQPIELSASQFDTLCNQMYGFPSALLNSKAASTYNNVVELERAFFTNTLKPLLTLVYNGISDGLGISKRNEWLIPDFSQVECLQKSQKDQAETINTKMEYLDKLRAGGYISKNKVLEEIGFEPVNDESFNVLTNEQPDNAGAQKGE